MSNRPFRPSSASLPTLEDAIRFKRLERPPPDFWEKFDQGLREKQLAALMEPTPRLGGLWQSLSLRTLKWFVPLGAAAAAALLVVVRPVAPHQPSESSGSAAPSADLAPVNSAFALAGSGSDASSTRSTQLTELVEAHGTRESDKSDAVGFAGAIAAVAAKDRSGSAEREMTPNEIAQALPWIGGLVAGQRRSPWLMTEMEWDRQDANGLSDWSFGDPAPQSVILGDLAAFQRQFTRLVAADLRITAAYAHNLPLVRNTNALASADTGRRADVDYDYRGGVSRVDVRGSSLSIRF